MLLIESNTTSVENNTDKAVEPSKSSGSSPPLDAEGLPLVSDGVYELREDFVAPQRRRSKKPTRLLARAGTRFMFVGREDHLVFELFNLSTDHENPPVFASWQRTEAAHPIVAKLTPASDDAASLLQRARLSARRTPYVNELLIQLIHTGHIAYSDLVAAAKYVIDHDDALFENMEIDARREAQLAADAAAEEAHEKNFASRRGLYLIADSNLICVYENNPWASAPELRDEMLAAFRAELEDRGLNVVAESSFPKVGPDAHYTRVLLIRDVFGDIERVRSVFQRHVTKSVSTVLTTKALPG